MSPGSNGTSEAIVAAAVSASATAATASASSDTLLIAVTRLEAKLDVALAQHGATLAVHAKDINDHEERLRAVEARRTVSPAALWTTVGSTIAAFGILAPYLASLIEGAS